MRLLPMLAMLAALAGSVASVASAAADGPALVIVIGSDGRVTAKGGTPAGFPLHALRKSIPELSLTEDLASDGAGPPEPERWQPVLDALTILLPRLDEGQARIAETRVDIAGTLRPGFSAESTRGAMRLALGNGWDTGLDIAEAPPPAGLSLHLDERGAALAGILPAGIVPAEALAVAGAGRDGGLVTGGGGDPADWRAALAVLGNLGRAYADAEASLSTGSVAISGTLLPGYDAATLSRWEDGRLPAGWELRLSGIAIAATEGDRRRNLATGEIERLEGGRWLPVYDFEPDPIACTAATDRALTGGGLSFVAGRTALDKANGPLLDRLAAIARRCLAANAVRLEIAGHTDDEGDDDANQALSERRAKSVLNAFRARGTGVERATAIGYGESRPIADNATPQGRARNRRIEFVWSY